MSKAATDVYAGGPLTAYSEDEQMFRASVREFAEGEIRPRVEEMDEHAKMSPEIIRQLFDLGLMCVETPEEYGGAGASFFTAIIVEKEFEGFTVGKKENKLGIRASSTTEIILDACRVPKENVLGEVGRGYKVSIETLNEGRIGIGAQMIGLARGALEHALRYTSEREQFGKTVNQFQAVQFQLAEMATDIEAARLLVYNAARMKDAGLPFVKEAAMAKLYSSRVAERVASRAIELYGGYGFVKDYPVEKLWRDSKIGAIYEGTSNMQLQTIAKLIIGK